MPNKRAPTAEDLLAFKFVSDVQLSPNGQTALFVLANAHPEKKKNTYQSHIWQVSTSGGPPRQFTNSAESESTPRWSPDGSKVLFTSARDADEAQKGKGQIWIIPSDGGEGLKLTRQKYGASSPKWAPDGKHILFLGRVPVDPEEDKKPKDKQSDVVHTTRLSYRFNGQGFTCKYRTHLFVVSARGGKARQLTSGDWDVDTASWSPDGTGVLFVGNIDEDTDMTYARNVYAVPAAGGRPKKLCGMPGWISAISPSPDGKTIAFVSSDMSRSYGTNNRIYRIPISGGKPECLSAKHDISAENNQNADARLGGSDFGLQWSPNGQSIKFIATVHGANRLYDLNLETGQLTAHTDGNRTVDSASYNRDHTAAVYTSMTPTQLAEVHVWQQNKRDRVLTRFNNALLNRLNLADPERFTFKAADGVEVEGWFMKPAGSRKRKHPTILEIHGGPRTAYGLGFVHEFQLLCAKGFAVYYINPRGSSSYGEDWACAVGGNYGERDYADIMDATDYVTEHYPVDPKRLGVTGGSYGGFMTNWIIGHTRRFKAACTQRCISNFMSFFGTSDIGWRFAQEEIGGLPWQNLEEYWKRSPLAYADQMQTPLLIIHSEEDYRCPIEQAEQIFVALKMRGIETELVRFPGENHELSRSGKPKHRQERLSHIVRWFEKHLIGGKP